MSARAVSVSLLALSLACSSSTGPSYDPQIPASFVAAVSNPYFPLVPGTTFTFSSQSETNTLEVLATTRVVNGVAATVVRDRVFVNGELREDTNDWFAQDAAGNVWYLGEDTREYENGQVVSTSGSWEWGVNGALPGIIMWADPAAQVGVEYRQEYYRGHAEDWGKVVATGQSVAVPFGQLNNCIRIEEWSSLESGRGYKYYCPQVGFALETNQSGGGRSQLISRTP